MRLSDEISERATALGESANSAMDRAGSMYDTIKTQVEKAVSAADCVKQINEMTESIMQISSQTSLLALMLQLRQPVPVRQEKDLLSLLRKSVNLRTRHRIR